MQLAQVLHTALRQIDVRLSATPAGHRRMAHQVGVGRLLAADHDGRQTCRADLVDAVLPCAVAAEDPDHHRLHAVQQLGQLAVDQP